MFITVPQCIALSKGVATKSKLHGAIRRGELKDYGQTHPGQKRHHFLIDEREYRAWLNPARYAPKDAPALLAAPAANAEDNGKGRESPHPFSKLAERLANVASAASAASASKPAPSAYEAELLAVLKDIRTLLQSLL